MMHKCNALGEIGTAVVRQNFSRPQAKPFMMEMARIRSSRRHSANTLENRSDVARAAHIYIKDGRKVDPN
jgi:hypothetical protein